MSHNISTTTTKKPEPPKIEYAYPTIEYYEELVGFKVNEGFKAGFRMARMLESQFQNMVERSEHEN